MRVETGANDKSAERPRRCRAAGTGLEQHGVAGDEGLNQLSAGQQQRIVPRADDEHHPKRIAMDFTAHTSEPERKSASVQAARGEDFSRFSFKKTAGFGERQNFSEERFDCGAVSR